MDDKRRPYFLAGLIIGTLGVGLALLAGRTPREQWGATLLRIMRDGLGLARVRYNNHPLVNVAEKAVDRISEEGITQATVGQTLLDALSSRR